MKRWSFIFAILIMIGVCSSCNKNDAVMYTPAWKYLNDIMEEYNFHVTEKSTTYYCQTYGAMNGDYYSTEYKDNYYDWDEKERWLLAYNIADYDLNGEEDLFTVELDPLNHDGEGNISSLRISRNIYFFDKDGNLDYNYWDYTPVSASEMEKVFTFVDNKLIEFSFYDYSQRSEGNGDESITYTVTDEIKSHITSMDVMEYNEENRVLEYIIEFRRYNYPSGDIAWNYDYDQYGTEYDVIEVLREQLEKCNITCVEMSFSSGWENRWENDFYISNSEEYPVFAFSMSPSVSEQCYDVEKLDEEYDAVLSTTKGTIDFKRYDYEERYSSANIDSTEVQETQLEKRDMIGNITLEQCQESPGYYIMYPDASFDPYYSGSVLYWTSQQMTYGVDDFPKDLVIDIGDLEWNQYALRHGKLVLFWPYENRVREGLYAVEESGYSLFRRDNGRLTGLFLTRASADGTGLVEWKEGTPFYWSNSLEYATINGISKDEYDGFPSTEGRDFASFPANETFSIGEFSGTTLNATEYQSDHMYFIHSDEESQFNSIPTTDGYQILDFSQTDPGEYVYTISRWNDSNRSREVYSTYILIE